MKQLLAIGKFSLVNVEKLHLGSLLCKEAPAGIICETLLGVNLNGSIQI